MSSNQIPAGVLHVLTLAVKNLQAAARALVDARTLDSRFGGEGRYEFETFQNLKFASGAQVVRTFREFAPGNGVDAEAVLRDLGGVPTDEALAMSHEGLAWEADQR